ncbi:hypothetical protein SESBI_31193 [Sesbania bispinosa]|nr:hypothetical protein SESBI_31193 [Sesbania bispinosa]
MDLDEWEFLSDDGYIDFNEDGHEKQLFPGKINLDMDYFYPSSPTSRRRNRITDPQRKPRVLNQLVPLPILLEPRIGKAPDEGLEKDITKNHPMEVTVVTSPSASSTEKIKDLLKVGPSVEADQDTVSQVFFKIKENEFVDMKIESPKSSSRGLWPPMDAGALKFEDKSEAMEIITSPRKKIEKEMLSNTEEDSTWDEENDSGFNIWKWSLTGVGAICTFGVAAATICVLFFGSQQKKKTQHEHKIRFQIYTDDKRIKQVVQHATKLNEAISAARGVPMSRAHITIGGYYDGL